MLLDSRVRPRVTPFDVTDQFPEGWQEDITAVAAEADFRDFPRTPILSREAADVTHITRGRVHAVQVQQRLPWLYKLYRDRFLELASLAWGEPIDPAVDDRYGVVLNVQQGNKMRFECHVDTNPVTGLLFFTGPPADGGGELAIAHNPAAVGVDEVNLDCALVTPQAGQLIFFDGQKYPHYARTLTAEHDTRVVAVMNFYTRSCPESMTRPRGLNQHLFGDD
jgi:2OG-Fe(II) oxygenase superfamily